MTKAELLDALVDLPDNTVVTVKVGDSVYFTDFAEEDLSVDTSLFAPELVIWVDERTVV